MNKTVLRKKTTARKRTKQPYSKGEINKLIDTLIHPLERTDKRFVLVDVLLHGLVEQNPPQTVRKFIKYKLPDLIRQLEKSSKDKM
jgi:hypothetical protein